MKKRIVLAVLAVLLAALAVWTAWGNTALTVTHYTLESDALPEEFDGFVIAQISDLHNAEFGAENERLLNALAQAQPDLIVITGDLVDSRRTDLEVAERFAAACVKIAPVCYVPGNHECRIESYDDLESALTDCGVTVLRNTALLLERSGSAIQIAGLEDPDFSVGRDWLFDGTAGWANQVLSDLVEENCFTVLLSHRPELFETYVAAGAELTFSGHAHGGQFRLPLIGGLVAPDQGLFPKYDAGVFEEAGCRMVVSRGLGNSLFPFRFNNRPELVMVTLSA